MGRAIAVLRLTGRRSGARYTIPVSYQRNDGSVTIITKRLRTWWRNLIGGAPVAIRLAGVDHAGTATAVAGGEELFDAVAAFLHGRRIDARAYGLELRVDGSVDPDDLRQIIDELVVVEVRLSSER
jgi:hypothetical protein